MSAAISNVILVPVICRKYRLSVQNVREWDEYFSGLSISAGQQAVDAWAAEIEAAENERKHNAAVMDIMNTNHNFPKRTYFIFECQGSR